MIKVAHINGSPEYIPEGHFGSHFDGVHFNFFESQEEADAFYAALPPPEIPEAPILTVEWSLDEPAKNKVTVKFVEQEGAYTLDYPPGFQWDDEWLINEYTQLFP